MFEREFPELGIYFEFRMFDDSFREFVSGVRSAGCFQQVGGSDAVVCKKLPQGLEIQPIGEAVECQGGLVFCQQRIIFRGDVPSRAFEK